MTLSVPALRPPTSPAASPVVLHPVSAMTKAERIRIARAEMQLTAIRARCQAQPPRPQPVRGRYLLLNDTRALEDHTHLGCTVVTRLIEHRMAALGFLRIGQASSADDCRALFDSGLGPADIDLILFNGEGSLHHDSPRCAALMAFCAAMKDLGVPSVLINAVWHANSPAFGAGLGSFSLVTLRDSLSQQEIRPYRPDAEVIPDLSFAGFAEEPRLPGTEGQQADPAAEIAVLDSVLPGVTLALGAFAETHGLPLYNMGPHPMARFYTERRFAYALGAQVYPRVLWDTAILRRARGCLTGRFHGLIAALVAGTPVVALASNTPKVESLLGDIGITDIALASADNLLSLPEDERWGLLTARFAAWTGATHARVAAFRRKAEDQIDALFPRITALARRA